MDATDFKKITDLAESEIRRYISLGSCEGARVILTFYVLMTAMDDADDPERYDRCSEDCHRLSTIFGEAFPLQEPNGMPKL